jgi:hypothetical protein
MGIQIKNKYFPSEKIYCALDGEIRNEKAASTKNTIYMPAVNVKCRFKIKTKAITVIIADVNNLNRAADATVINPESASKHCINSNTGWQKAVAASK